MNQDSLHPVGIGLAMFALAACGEPSTGPIEERLPSAASALADAPNTWITRAEIPRIRARFVRAAVTNLAGRSTVYIIDASGQSATLQAYDVGSNTWSESFPALPLNGRGNDFNSASAINGKVYVTGGRWRFRADRGCLNHVRRFDPATKKWSVISFMPTSGGGGITGVINNQLYILTGCPEGDESQPYTPSAFYRYNPATNQWTTLPLPTSRHSHGMGGVIGGKFYVVGGDDQLNLLEVYNPATNTWTTKARMPLGQFAATGRWEGASVALGGKLYVIGGSQIDISGARTNVRTTNVYDPATNTWSVKRPLPTGLAGLVASRVLVNGQARIELVHSSYSPSNLQYTP